MSARYTIAVDAMGGDFGPRVTLSAAQRFLAHHPQVHLILCGALSSLQAQLTSCPESLLSRLQLIDAPDVIAMHAKPSHAVRHGQNSSMYHALQQVQLGNAQACVSAGNTGALMALGRTLLHTLPGIDRPAILSAIPTLTGHSYLLDLGANVDSSPEQLLQFALMGAATARSLDKWPEPRIALLNIGREEVKGNEQVRCAARLFKQQAGLNYIGFIEGDDVFTGQADVIVCDGFTGNIALKSNEGLARLIAGKLRRSFQRNLYRRFLGWLARPVLQELQRQIDPGQRNGASFVGLRGIVIKSHGGAGKRHFECALRQALVEIENNLPARIAEQMTQSTSEEAAKTALRLSSGA
ncbi:phosphate acyltransferase PlsX [Nitrincola tapanii]|uniref:Phosphate acyltransferase n=1 Tax=Nitrincola tapanii TaxID=1708751 RepID=A0A5A9W7M7_9GAMM|nr:phosphate acyltransferase PlsX [Nitrincola tapanii]KAA0875461.1 phosphate acyltransferase PlsX [Nitrincola tapanii]